jgi:anti-anti-sigma regulatory factor
MQGAFYMAGGAELFSLNYIKESDIMVGAVLGPNLDKAEANQIFQYYKDEIAKHPEYSDFILDARKAEVVTNSAIGVLMKALETMKRGNTYGILVMTEKLLQEVMLQFPEMFDFYAVFHTIEDAVAYVKKRRAGG